MSSWWDAQDQQGWSSASHWQAGQGWQVWQGWQAGSDRQQTYTHDTDPQAGIDRQTYTYDRQGHDDCDDDGEDDPVRRTQWPRFDHKPSKGPRGRGSGGSKHGWGADSTEDEMPSWLIM